MHNGSSLFTGDAGQGESNIRRWLIENDWLEAIVALPLNLFYNTGIATYVWVLANRKPQHRRGRVQLIDASQSFKPLRKNLGKKNCELAEEDILHICDAYLAFQETPQSKIFPNEAFGYWKIAVERPLRLHSQLSSKAIEALRFASGDEDIRRTLFDQLGEPLFSDFQSVRPQLETLLHEWGTDEAGSDGDDENAPEKKGLSEKKKRKLLDPKTWERDARLVETATALRRELGDNLFEDHNFFCESADAACAKLGLKLGSAELNTILRAVSWRVETAPPVISKIHKSGKGTNAPKANPLHGFYQANIAGKTCVVEYKPDSEFRDTEQIPLLETGGIEAFFRREVLPYTPDAWIDPAVTKIGYEISFTRHFYQPQPLRSLEEIRKDIAALEDETKGLLSEIVGAR